MRKYGVPYRLPDGSINPAWTRAYYVAHKPAISERNRRYAKAHRVRMRNLWRTWRRTHRDRVRETQRERTLKFKRQAVLKTNGAIQCAVDSCGCDDLTILQANYKEGGHSSLAAKGKMHSGGLNLYRDIALGRVSPELFNFLCPPHNSIDHLRELRKKFRIQWTP